MAKEKTPETVEAFVLRDCGFGMAGDVVSLSVEDANAGAEQGALDLNLQAIMYAKAPKE